MNRIKNPSLSWNDDDVPSSTVFDDVYFYRKNGLAEARMVFLEANNLPAAWQDQKQFTIAETGFGSGLNFLATWQMFEENSNPDQRLDFISVEQFPLHKDDLAKAINPWRDALGSERIDRLVHIYPMRIPGFHRIWFTDKITLTLIFDDALRGFKQLDCPIDAWYLDGFAPKKNMEMWRGDLYAEMARLSHADTSLASFTAAGHVRRGLKEVGFDIKRVDGFGYKFHRIIGRFNDGQPKPPPLQPKHVTIIGAGLAGAGVAHALHRRGILCTVLEKASGLGQGASGNKLGLINPKIEAQDNPRNDAGLSAFSFATHILRDLKHVDYRQTGSLHLATDEAKTKRLKAFYERGDWLEPHMQWSEKGLLYQDTGMVNTASLVKALLQDADIRFNAEMAVDGPTVLACGWGLHDLPIATELPLQPVRGQVTYTQINNFHLEKPIMFGHYVAPLADGSFCMGASFNQNDDDPVPRSQDDSENIEAAATTLSIPIENIAVTGHWSSIRTASRDRFPIVGKLPDADSIYVSGALGSHGIQFGLLHGEIIACLLTGAPLPIGRDALQSLSVSRFYQDKK